MFASYEFSFAGRSSLEYGLMIYDFDGNTQDDVPFGNEADIIESRVLNRVTPLHFGVNYHDNPLEFKLVFGAERYLDRYELQNIALWLTGHQNYQWLSIDQPDLSMVQFHCLVTDLTPISHGWLPIAFEATVRCDCPYAYGFPFVRSYTISGQTNILFQNEGSVREHLKPMLTFTPGSGVTSLSIVNHSDGAREFLLDDLPSSVEIEVDNVNGIIQEKNYGYNLYPGFNLNFLRLVHGDNSLTVTGDGVLKLSGRFLYNVAG